MRAHQFRLRLGLYYGKFRGGLHRGSRECTEGRDGMAAPPTSVAEVLPPLLGLLRNALSPRRQGLAPLALRALLDEAGVPPTAASTNASRRPSGSPAAPAATPRGHPPGSGCMRRPAEVLAFSARRARGSRQLSSAVHSLSAAAADCPSSFRTTGASRRLISSRKLSTPCSSPRSTSGCCARILDTTWPIARRGRATESRRAPPHVAVLTRGGARERLQCARAPPHTPSAARHVSCHARTTYARAG